MDKNNFNEIKKILTNMEQKNSERIKIYEERKKISYLNSRRGKKNTIIKTSFISLAVMIIGVLVANGILGSAVLLSHISPAAILLGIPVLSLASGVLGGALFLEYNGIFEKFKDFSNANTEFEKLEEISKNELELAKLEARKEILEQSRLNLKSKNALTPQKHSYKKTELITEMKKIDENIQKETKELDILIAKKYLKYKFASSRNIGLGLWSDLIIRPVTFAAFPALLILTPAALVSFLGFTPSIGYISILMTVALGAEVVYGDIYSDNKFDLFQKLNSELGKDAIPGKSKYDEDQFLADLNINNKIREIANLRIQKLDTQIVLRNLNMNSQNDVVPNFTKSQALEVSRGELQEIINNDIYQTPCEDVNLINLDNYNTISRKRKK